MTNTKNLGVIFLLILVIAISCARHSDYGRGRGLLNDELSLWINEMQVKVFSGFQMKVFAIDNGRVNPHVRDKVSFTRLWKKKVIIERKFKFNLFFFVFIFLPIGFFYAFAPHSIGGKRPFLFL